ncbi:MAG: prepilin peptidase [Candidatus Tectomicrobia bacterium]|uniref:Prepilin leader peptidase/N-methyltransferase n=1 Tax=Tectimicrobiota bacterium TaxID=2528274 RepID=A0A932FWV2_UNCTE|nr:prepilin peptidase [Candidatus Tectomicrobia bacterium]
MLPDYLLNGIAFVLGTILGSFANVCIYRIPRGESILWPASHCPQCQGAIRARDNLPLLSHLWLRGQCRDCGVSISWQYPLVELLTGLTYLLIFRVFGLSLASAVYAVLATALIIVSFIDLEHQIVPDVITLPGLALGLLLSTLFLPITFLDALVGALLGGGIFYAIAMIYEGGMGGGDIKLIAMIGAFIGWRQVLLTIFVAAFIGSLIGGTLMVTKKRKRKDPIPFGPFLALGAIVALFWGDSLLHWYLSLRFL